MVFVILFIIIIIMLCKPKKTRVEEGFSAVKEEGYTIEENTPEGDVLEGDVLEGDTIEENTPEGDVLEGDTIEENTPEGDVLEGDTIEENTLEGDTIEENTLEGDVLEEEEEKEKNLTNYYIGKIGFTTNMETGSRTNEFGMTSCKEQCKYDMIKNQYTCNDGVKLDGFDIPELRSRCLKEYEFRLINDYLEKCENHKSENDTNFCTKYNIIQNNLLNLNENGINNILDIYFENEKNNKSIHSKQSIQQFSNSDDGYGRRLEIAFNKILKLKNKFNDKINKDDIYFDTRKSLNYNLYLNICQEAYQKAIEDCSLPLKSINDNTDSDSLKQIVEEVEGKKQKVKDITINIIHKFKEKGLLSLVFDDNVDRFIEDMEEYLGFKIKVISKFTDGSDYDENGNLREHQANAGGSYLITALTKAKLLSIGQVYQLRKLMLEAFKVESNRPFFSFYYDNFEPIANMLVKQNRLSEILPNMLKCIDLSKNEQFDLAFEQYIVTARQAYQICKNMRMNTKDLEDKFEQLDGTIDQLPEPNSLFVENGFREALRSC